MFYNPMPAALTPARAWLEAALHLQANGGSLGGLMLHIEEPLRSDPLDISVIQTVDSFLHSLDKFTIATVANTIFPATLDRGDGIDSLSARYLAAYKRAMRKRGSWGRYFERMVNWEDRQGGHINQIAEIIDMLFSAKNDGPLHKNRYEIMLFDPARDLRRPRNRQCLSMIELKPDTDGLLHMMAIYRSHFYLQKALGNLIGLGELLGFIARESGFDVGTLTVNSTAAQLERDGWNKADVDQLLTRCQEL